MIETICKKCGNIKNFNEDKLGKKFKCSNCGNVVSIEESLKLESTPTTEKESSLNHSLSSDHSPVNRNRKWIIISGIFVMISIVIAVIYFNNSYLKTKTQVQNGSVVDTTYVPVNSQINDIDNTNPTQLADLKLRLFFKNMDATDENGNITEEGTIDERTDFQKDKGYTFCYDSEDFYKFEIGGTGKNISIIIIEDGKIFFRKDNFEISGKKIFTTQDFIFSGMAEYKITIMQGNIVLFEGKIDSQGCM